jgi:hypothetical protein
MKEKLIKDNEKIIEDELQSFYQEWQEECKEEHIIGSCERFIDEFDYYMKKHFRNIYDEYNTRSYGQEFFERKLKEREESKYDY